MSPDTACQTHQWGRDQSRITAGQRLGRVLEPHRVPSSGAGVGGDFGALAADPVTASTPQMSLPLTATGRQA